MEKTTGHILKSGNIKLEGSFLLDAGRTVPRPATAKTGAVPQARIVENHPEFAVLEITCSCGSKAYLRCEYALQSTNAKNIPADRQANQQKISGENDNEN